MLFVRDRVLMFSLISFDAYRAKIPCKNETFSSNFSILCKGQRLGFDKMYQKKCHIKCRERLMKPRKKKIHNIIFSLYNDHSGNKNFTHVVRLYLCSKTVFLLFFVVLWQQQFQFFDA